MTGGSTTGLRLGTLGQVLKATVGPPHRQASVLRDDDDEIVRETFEAESEVKETYPVPEVCGLSHMTEQADLNNPRQHLDQFQNL